MKKTAIFLSILAIAATAASVALAQDAAVYSANTIGVIKYQIPGDGALTCISLPLNSMQAGEWTFGDTGLADALPVGSKVYFWDGTGWSPSTKSPLSKQFPAAILAKEIKQGEGIFIKQPAGAAAQEIAIVGELPTDATATNAITGGGNLDMTSATFYPVDVVFGDTELASKLPAGSKVYFWDGEGWSPATKSPLSKQWPTTILTKEIKIGEAIFVKSATAMDIVEECPYDLD